MIHAPINLLMILTLARQRVRRADHPADCDRAQPDRIMRPPTIGLRALDTCPKRTQVERHQPPKRQRTIGAVTPPRHDLRLSPLTLSM